MSSTNKQANIDEDLQEDTLVGESLLSSTPTPVSVSTLERSETLQSSNKSSSKPPTSPRTNQVDLKSSENSYSASKATIAVPSTKPARSNETLEPSSDSNSPAHSPSSLSISSKATIKTGFGHHRSTSSVSPSRSANTNRLYRQPGNILNFDSMMAGSGSSGSGGGGNLATSTLNPNRKALHARSSSMSSPKVSPSNSRTGGGVSSTRKSSDPSMVSTTSSKAATAEQTQKKLAHQPQEQAQLPIFSMLDHPPLPIPRKASKCPLFCCFYAEFDNVVGPKISFESPQGFMEQSTDVSLSKIYKLLATNFDRILAENGAVKKSAKDNEPARTTPTPTTRDTKDVPLPRDQVTPTESPVTKGETLSHFSLNQTDPTAQFSDSIGTVPAVGTDASDSHEKTAAVSTTATEKQTYESAGSTEPTAPSAAYAAASSSAASTSSTTNHKERQHTSTSATNNESTTTSIFDSTSDFIITGAELSGTIVNLSAFNMHLLTRPTVIHNKRYERNSLLFCVGFVLRRTEDPRPFRPLLSKLALTLKRMEMESHFLSKQSSRMQLQPLLDRILVSLNGTHWETNLVVHNNVLNLKLFHPPKYPASQVPDHAVPILLRRDWQINLHDWDLAINWVVLHIDGVANARQISKKAEVDMEMVRNCLRVLKHHSVIAIVDMFFYSNRYESTKRAASMLAGYESSLLHEAAAYVLKRPQVNSGRANISANALAAYNTLTAPLSSPTSSPVSPEKYVRPPTPVNVHTGTSPTSPVPSSSPPVASEGTATLSSSLLGSSLKYATYASYHSQGDQLNHNLFASLHREEQEELKRALAELYAAFHRNINFGDIWVGLATGVKSRSSHVDISMERKKSGKKERGSQKEQRQQRGGSNANPNISNTRMDSTQSAGTAGSREQEAGRGGGGGAPKVATMDPKQLFLDRLVEKSACSHIDWSHVFEIFDHRRFVSFGLVHGLLHRVHNYPFFLGNTITGINHSGATTMQRQGSRGTSNLNAAASHPPSSSSHHNYYTMEDKSVRLARNVASMMDGLHCDDDIVSYFKRPIDELISLVEKNEGRKVLSLYSLFNNRH